MPIPDHRGVERALKNLLQFIMRKLKWIPMQTEVGDKVRMKGARSDRARGIVEEIRCHELLVRRHDTGTLVAVPTEGVTNFSLAARKAWQNMPNRRVGRPKGARHCDRVSVTLRIDRELWERFRHDESQGLIQDRTATVNAWLREMMDRIQQQKDCVNGA